MKKNNGKIIKSLLNAAYIMVFFFVISLNSAAWASEKFSLSAIENAKKASVSISSRIALSAYDKNLGTFEGTGFIVDKQRGWLFCYGMVFCLGSFGSYFLIFYICLKGIG